jgi:DNA polymerase-3 subunit gamma/tau
MEDIQLFYQIAIIGRRDLSLSPDPRSGVEMTLLRMLAFKPAAEDKNDSQERVLIDDGLKKNKNDEHKIKEQNSSYDTEIKENSSKGHNDINWSDLLEELNLDGTLKLLAGNCVYIKKERNIIFLNLDNRSESLYTKEHQEHLANILSSHLGEELEVKISIKSKENESPIQQKERAARNLIEKGRLRLENDSNIKAIKKVFGATVKSDSIKLKKK